MQLEARNITFSYGKRKILSDLSFTADSGEIIALLGRNGSGKTTLLRILLGFLRPAAGEVLIDTRNSLEMSGRERAKAVAYIPQSSEMVYAYTVLDTVMMGRAPELSLFERPGKEDKEKAEEILEDLGITHLKERSINAISGGEKQLVLIARALTQDAKILLLDEPTSALDYSNQLIVLETLEKLRSNGYTIIFSTHNPEQALMNATRVMILSSNRTPFIGKPEDLLDGRILEDLYNRELCIKRIDTGRSERIICIPR